MSKKWDYVNFNRDMADPDPDKPHQALFDLGQELEKGVILDEGIQKQVFQHVIKQALENTHSDVQGAAVKCIPMLVKKVKEAFVVDGVMRLSQNLTAKKKEHRDIATISLKYIVENIPASSKECIRSFAFFIVKLMKSCSDDVKLDLMDVATDLLRRFGGQLVDDHDPMQTVFLDALSSSSQSVRKRAITCLATLSVHTSEHLFQDVIEGHVIKKIETERGESLRRYMQLCSTISRTAGQRVGPFLERIMPLLLTNLDDERLDQIDDDGERNEVRENILQAFESFTQRCPQQITPFMPQVINACKEGMSYDPYYDYGDEEEADGDEDMACDEEDDYQDMLEAEADDDDDISWKVRKAAAKCLSALIQARPDCLNQIYEAVCSKEARDLDLQQPTASLRKCLPERFKEREESVRLDIFKVFADLLKATQVSVSSDPSLGPEAGMSGSYSTSFRLRIEALPEVRNLLQIKDFVVDCIVKASKDKSNKVKTTCFALLKLFTSVLKNELEGSIVTFLRLIKETLSAKDATSALKTEVLQFLLMLIATCPPHSPEAQKVVPELLPLVITCVNDKYYRIISESLRVCGELAPVVVQGPDAKERCVQLFDVVFDRLSTADVDQEVKDCAIATMGNILKFSNSKSSQQHLSEALVNKCFRQLLVLLGGDFSRIPVIKCLTVTKDVPMDPQILNKFVPEICSFLRKSSRPLRQASLHCLTTHIVRKGKDLSNELLNQILMEVIPLLTDVDLHLSHLAIELCNAVLITSPETVTKTLETSILPKFIELLKSPLLQGSALQSLESVFLNLGPVSLMGYHSLLQIVLSAAETAGDNRQILTSVAAVAAQLTSSASDDQKAKTIEQYIASLSTDDKGCALGLSCLGEVGKKIDLSDNTRAVQAVRERFDHPKEEIKTLAGRALGKITAGNPDQLLGGLISGIANEKEHRYLLLRSLKETLTRSDASNDFDPLKRHYASVLNVCLEFAGCEDEGTRNVVSECLGKLALLDPAAVVKGMVDSATKAGPLVDTTATIITAVRYAVSESGFKYDKLAEDLKYFLHYIAKPEGVDKAGNLANVKVRRASVQLFTTAVHSKPELVRSDLKHYMNMLLKQTAVDDELVRSVNLGPFVHKVDDGLELRKASFECIDILLDGCFSGDSLLEYLNDYAAICSHTIAGMKVNQGQDIQALNFSMFAKISKLSRAQVSVLSCLDTIFADDFLPKMVGTFLTRLNGKNTVQQDKDKIQDLLTVLLKAAQALKAMPGADDKKSLEKFFTTTVPTFPGKVLTACGA